MRTPVRVILFIAAITSISSALLAQPFAKSKRATLANLPKFYVLIEDLVDPEAFKDVLITEEQVRTDVELRVRAAKLPISGSGLAYLYVRPVITALDRGLPDGRYAYTIEVAFRQPVRISANGKQWLASTWEEGTLGIGTRRALADKLRENIRDLVDRFINDALAAREHE